MPSFDIVSKINMQEVDNAVNSVLRELTNRYDFKGAVFSIELKAKENLINISADSEYKLGALRDSLKVFATKRGIDVKALDFQKEEKAGGTIIRQEIKLKNGIEQEIAKKITKQVKDTKMKVQASIKGDEVRIDGKKRDDLQEAMAILRNTNYEIPLQFINFRE
jgi:cyclic-di-GMP-binding protein